MKHEINTVEALKNAIRECYDQFPKPSFNDVIGELFDLYSFNEDEPELKKFADVYNFMQSTIYDYQLLKNKQNKQLNFITDNLFKRNLYWLKDKTLTIVEVIGINGFDVTKEFYNLNCKLTIIDFSDKPNKDIKKEEIDFSSRDFIYYDKDLKQYKFFDYIMVV